MATLKNFTSNRQTDSGVREVQAAAGRIDGRTNAEAERGEGGRRRKASECRTEGRTRMYFADWTTARFSVGRSIGWSIRLQPTGGWLQATGCRPYPNPWQADCLALPSPHFGLVSYRISIAPRAGNIADAIKVLITERGTFLSPELPRCLALIGERQKQETRAAVAVGHHLGSR